MLLVSFQLKCSLENYPPGSFDNGWWSFKEEMALDLEMNGELKCFCVLSVLYLYSCRCDDKQK